MFHARAEGIARLHFFADLERMRVNYLQIPANVSALLLCCLGETFCEADSDDEDVPVTKLDALRFSTRLKFGNAEPTARPRVIRERHCTIFAEEAYEVE